MKPPSTPVAMNSPAASSGVSTLRAGSPTRATDSWKRAHYFDLAAVLARKPDRPTAVFAANDMLAVGAMVFARSAGLSIPDDIAIAGFDDIPAARLLGLTTVRQPEFDLGALAARTLVERLRPDGLKPRGQSLELKFEIMKRSSA